MSETVAEQALAGWERARDRQRRSEARAQTFFQAAALTTTLVLANSTLLRGDDKLTGAAALIVLPTLLLAMAALIAAGLYGMFGSMYLFSTIGPTSLARVRHRAALSDQEAMADYVGWLAASQRRAALLADWKLARLRRAMWWLLTGVIALAVASGTLVIDAL